MNRSKPITFLASGAAILLIAVGVASCGGKQRQQLELRARSEAVAGGSRSQARSSTGSQARKEGVSGAAPSPGPPGVIFLERHPPG